MKNLSYILCIVALSSCNKIEEKIDKTTQVIQTKAEEQVQKAVQNTINKSVEQILNGEEVPFETLFPQGDSNIILDYKAKMVNLPTGDKVVIMHYRSDPSLLFPLLEQQPTTDEAKSDKNVVKIDGKSFVQKLKFIEKFLPEGTLDTAFLDDMKSEKNLEFYRLMRFPNKSTLIVDSKKQKVYQIVEIKS